jgi:hypothetical protein
MVPALASLCSLAWKVGDQFPAGKTDSPTGRNTKTVGILERAFRRRGRVTIQVGSAR